MRRLACWTHFIFAVIVGLIWWNNFYRDPSPFCYLFFVASLGNVAWATYNVLVVEARR